MTRLQTQLLHNELDNIIADCTECGNCVKQCGYLQRYGTPAVLAKEFKAGMLDVEIIYSCNLCSLCDVFCPEKLEPSYLFWLMRCNMVAEGRAPLKQHRRILAYERRGLSGLFQLTVIPENATTVFFPGCALAGLRPQQTLKLFEILQHEFPAIGIVLSCCTKPSHDLGRIDFFSQAFGRLIDNLRQCGITSIITACPSCHQIFEKYAEGFNVKTVYETLSVSSNLPKLRQPVEITIHDPCSTRFDNEVHRSIRAIAVATGCTVTEMKHRQKRTLCCGEGGSACFVAPDITDKWAEKRAEQTEGKPVITYCAGCVQFLSKKMDTFHIIDLLLEPGRTLSGKMKVSSTPFTYINRLMLKRKLKNEQK